MKKLAKFRSPIHLFGSLIMEKKIELRAKLTRFLQGNDQNKRDEKVWNSN